MATSKAETPQRVTAKEMKDRLRRHYIKPGDQLAGGVFLPEVTMGRSGGSRVDAIYVGFTSNRGEYLIGHEIKVSRSDWLAELDNPAKAEVWASQCHAWYAVAPSTDIIRPEELPPGWGLLVINSRTKTRLDTIVKADMHPDRQPSWTTALSILKKQDTLNTAEVAEIRRDADQKARAELAKEAERRASRGLDEGGMLRRRAEEAEKVVVDIAKKLGITVERDSYYDARNALDRVTVTGTAAELIGATSDLGKALPQRDYQLEAAARDLRLALDAVEKARGVITDLSGRPPGRW